MPIHFKLTERLMGYAASTAGPGEQVAVCYRDLIGPEDGAHLQLQLENLQASLFSKIPSLPSPSFIDHLLIVIKPDLECTAYVNELEILAQVKTTGAVEKGAPVYVSDISDITSVKVGVDVPPDCGVVFVRSTGWKRSLFFDFGPLSPDIGPRNYPLQQLFARQALLLLGMLPDVPGDQHAEGAPTRIQRLEDGLARLKWLLSERCEAETAYQELLEAHPWMLLGGMYAEILRHRALDDRNVPDFTAVRCYDGCHDIVELKQPFLRLFRKNTGYTSDFNEAWNQAERYLSFAREQRSYLRHEKELRFESPRCILLLGYGLDERELRELRRKETFGGAISIFTYDHLVQTASHLVSLMRTAHERPIPDPGEGLANSALQQTKPSLRSGFRS